MEDSAGSSPSCLFSSNREAADEIVPTKSAPAAAVIINGSGPPLHPVVDCSLERKQLREDKESALTSKLVQILHQVNPQKEQR